MGLRAITFGRIEALAETPAPAPEMLDQYGRVDVPRYDALCKSLGRELRVYLDDHDVTDRCKVADDVGGWVELFLLHDDRKYFDSQGKIATRRYRGEVAI